MYMMFAVEKLHCVFIIIPVVNGKYGQWSSWASCSSDCGSGVNTRGRKCNSPAPQNGGKGCVGAAVETKACNSYSRCPGKSESISGFISAILYSHHSPYKM